MTCNINIECKGITTVISASSRSQKYSLEIATNQINSEDVQTLGKAVFSEQLWAIIKDEEDYERLTYAVDQRTLDAF